MTLSFNKHKNALDQMIEDMERKPDGNKTLNDELKKVTKTISSTSKKVSYIQKLIKGLKNNLFTESEDLQNITQFIAQNNYLDEGGNLFFKRLEDLSEQNNYSFYLNKNRNVFQVMANNPICATNDNLKKAADVWQKNNNKKNHFQIIDEFSEITYKIPFSRTNCIKCIKDLKNDFFFYPFLCHLYVDYFDDILSPLSIIQQVYRQNISPDKFNFFRIYGISYIWKILNIAEDMIKEELPFEKTLQQLEIKITFPEEKLKREMSIENTPPIYLLTETIDSEKVINMILYILKDGNKSILSYLKGNDKISTFAMIAQISFKILNYIKTKRPDLLNECFQIICIIASSRLFIDPNKDFTCISFLIQFLIDFYTENKKLGVEQQENSLVLTQKTENLFKQFILKGPSFFSFLKSRKNNESLLTPNENNESLLPLNKNNKVERDLYIYAGYPKLISEIENGIENNAKIAISYAIQTNEEKFGIKEWIKKPENVEILTKNKGNSSKSQGNEDNNNDYFFTVLPYFIFQEAKVGVPATENEGLFHGILRELLSKDTYQIGTKIWNRYLLKQGDNDYYKIFLNKSYKKIKNYFFSYMIQFLILVKDSTIILHVEESNFECKKLFIKFFIMSLPVEKRDEQFLALIKSKNSNILLKGIEEKAKEYCDSRNLMESAIMLIGSGNAMEKLDIYIKYLSNHLKELSSNFDEQEKRNKRKLANYVLEKVIKQIKCKTDATLLNQMCKKIYKTFGDSLKGEDDQDESDDDFVLQLFTSFAYESINLIATKAAMKKITKIIKGLNSRKSKIVTVAIFNFFEEKRSEHDLILKILNKEGIINEKRKAIYNNSGHLFLKEKNFCNACLKRFTKSGIHTLYQFFSCTHLFHLYDCIGNRGRGCLKNCPICPNSKQKEKQSNKMRVKDKNAELPDYFETYFTMKDQNFKKSIEVASSSFDLNASTPNLIKYHEVSPLFDDDDEISITFDDE